MNALDQLNLMLWLAWGEVPSDDSVNPVFRRSGFELVAIGPSIPITLPYQRQLQEAGFKPKQAVSPDLFLQRHADFLLSPLECKESSFGPSSSTSAQAAALLAVPGMQIAQDLGLIPPSRLLQMTSRVCYAINGGQEGPLADTLSEIRAQLRRAGLAPNPAHVLGIYEEDTGVYLQEETEGYLGQNGPVQVLKAGASVFPLIPWDPSLGKHEAGRRDLEERLRAQIVAFLGAHLDEALQGPLQISLDDLLRQALPIWIYWRDRDARRRIRRAARGFLRKLLQQLEDKAQLVVRPQSFGWTVEAPSREAVTMARRHLKSTSVRQLTLPLELSGQGDFGAVASEWDEL